MSSTSEKETVTPQKLWEHKDPKSTQTYKFMQHINKKYGKTFGSYDDLYQWSINNTADFWGEVWDYTGVRGTRFTKVCKLLS
jgi:acetoacetyl-CoA synthetase